MKSIRHILLLTALLAAPAAAQTERDARHAAEQMLGKHALQQVKLDTRAKAKGATATGGNVYAYNADGGGFAIVCAGGGRTAVAGYSDTGSLNADAMPDAMKAWLATYTEAMSAANNDADGEYAARWEGPTVAPVAPFITTRWGQGAPFNSQCPKSDNGKKQTLAGCSAVALAQVLNYFHTDRKGGGTLHYDWADSETEYDVDYATATYDWTHMRDTYAEGAYTDQEAKAVGKLMFEAAVASKAEFGYEATSATIPFVALNKYYNFECQYVNRQFILTNYSMTLDATVRYNIATQKWMDIIQSELSAHRPIIYSASNVNSEGNIYSDTPQEHCFILDGIDDKNYVHVNWGWGGFADGYYDIALLNPPIQWNSCGKSYYGEHCMIVGIEPRGGDYEEALYQWFPFNFDAYPPSRGDVVKSPAAGPQAAKASSVTDARTGVDRAQVFVATNSYDALSVRFAVVLTRDGNIVYDLNRGGSYNPGVPGWPSGGEWKLSGCLSSVPQVADGTYELRIAYRDASNQLRLCPTPAQYVTHIRILDNASKMAFTDCYGDGIETFLTVDDITPASDIYAGTAFYLKVKAHGVSGSHALQFRNVETGKVYTPWGNSSENTSDKLKFSFVYNNLTGSEVFRFQPRNVDNNFTMPAGRYKVELYADEEDEEYTPAMNMEDEGVRLAKDFYIDVKERPSYPILDGNELTHVHFYNIENWDKVEKQGCHITGSGIVWQYASNGMKYANKVDDPVDVMVYMVNRDTGEEHLLATMKDWTPGLQIPVYTCTYPLNGDFEFHTRYLTPDGERTTLAPKAYFRRDPYAASNLYHVNPAANDFSNGLWCMWRSARTSADGKGIDIVLHHAGTAHTGCMVKGLFWNADEGTVVADSVAVASAAADGTVTCTLRPQLKAGVRHEAILLFNSGDTWNNCRTWSYVLNDDRTVASFTINEDGTTGIADAPAAFTSAFTEGEAVTVYALNGRAVLSLPYSARFWTDIEATLPHGTFVLKGAKTSIRFCH